MKRKQLVRYSLLIGPLGTALAACAGGGGGGNAPPSAQTAQEDKFGLGFGMAFRANPNSEPLVLVDSDIIPISFTTEPLDVS